MYVVHNGHEIEYDDSIQDLNICRFQTYNFNVLLDAAIGSDLNDFDSRVNMVAMLIDKDPDKAKAELANFQQLVHFVMSNTTPKFNSFAALVTSIDGDKIDKDELSEADIKDILKRISEKRFSFRTIVKAWRSAKKKMDLEFDVFFPALINDPVTIDAANHILKRAVYLMRSIYAPSEEIQAKIREADDHLISKIKPKVFGGRDGLEVKTLKWFPEICTLLQQNGISQPKRMTVLEFYQTVETIEKQAPKK